MSPQLRDCTGLIAMVWLHGQVIVKGRGDGCCLRLPVMYRIVWPSWEVVVTGQGIPATEALLWAKCSWLTSLLAWYNSLHHILPDVIFSSTFVLNDLVEVMQSLSGFDFSQIQNCAASPGKQLWLHSAHIEVGRHWSPTSVLVSCYYIELIVGDRRKLSSLFLLSPPPLKLSPKPKFCLPLAQVLVLGVHRCAKACHFEMSSPSWANLTVSWGKYS